MSSTITLTGGPFDQSVAVDDKLFQSGTIQLTDVRTLALDCGLQTETVRVGRYQKRLHQAHIWDWKGWYRQ